jgi:hypothetical protein
MFLQDFENFVNKLRFNDTLVYNNRIIFGLITGQTLVTEQDFENWFTDAISELGLVEDLHYRYREAGDINSVVVRGTVGLNLLL